MLKPSCPPYWALLISSAGIHCGRTFIAERAKLIATQGGEGCLSQNVIYILCLWKIPAPSLWWVGNQKLVDAKLNNKETQAQPGLYLVDYNEKPYLILTLFYVHRWKIIDETSTKSIFDKVSHQLSSWDLFKFFMEILKTLFLAKDSLRKFLQVVCFLNTWGLRAFFLHVAVFIFKRV